MGNCIYCGEPAGFLKKTHKECKQHYEQGKSEIVSLIGRVGSEGGDLKRLESTIEQVAAGGGLMMIKEAINEDVNGYPAILRVRKGLSKKAVSELTWATDQKIYTLSTNSALQGKNLASFIDLARKLSD